MSTTVSPSLDSVYTKLAALLAFIVPTGVQVLKGLPNRAATPAGDYVTMQLILQQRLATNETTYSDPFPDPGLAIAKQSRRLDVQVDFYGEAAAEWATMFSTLFRSNVGCDALGPECQPLHADDARQIPHVTGEDQYQERHCVTAALQWNPITSTAQDFADTLLVDLIDVDITYPP